MTAGGGAGTVERLEHPLELGRRDARAAIDHAHVKPETMIAGAREIAFFPPMTGG